MNIPRLGVNIDHVATLRQLRGTPYPSLLEAAALSVQGGATQITVHLREDRRHIQPEDVIALRRAIGVPLNLEMAVEPRGVAFACKLRPAWVCLVPEKRQEVTTEGGLALAKNKARILRAVRAFKKARIKVSFFIEPSLKDVALSQALGADAVELHSGRYCLATQGALGKMSTKLAKVELGRLEAAAREAHALGLGVHVGHGFDAENVRAVAALEVGQPREPLFMEYNIGHWIVCRAALVGMERATREMRAAILAP